MKMEGLIFLCDAKGGCDEKVAVPLWNHELGAHLYLVLKEGWRVDQHITKPFEHYCPTHKGADQ